MGNSIIHGSDVAMHQSQIDEIFYHLWFRPHPRAGFLRKRLYDVRCCVATTQAHDPAKRFFWINRQRTDPEQCRFRDISAAYFYSRLDIFNLP